MGTVPPELTEAHTDVQDRGSPPDRVAVTLRDPGADAIHAGVEAPIEVGGRRSPEEVVIARAAAGTLPLEPRRAKRGEQTLMSPQDPLAARQGAHNRSGNAAQDGARTLLSGLAAQDAPPARAPSAWVPPAPQAAPPGGTLLSPPIGGGGGPALGPGYAGYPTRQAQPSRPRGPSTTMFAVAAIVGIVVLGVAAFAGTYYGARAHAHAPPPVPPIDLPTPPPIATPIAPTPTPPAAETATPTPALKPIEPAVCRAYRSARAKPATPSATLAALAHACAQQGGTVSTAAPTITPPPPAPTPVPTPAVPPPRMETGY